MKQSMYQSNHYISLTTIQTTFSRMNCMSHVRKKADELLRLSRILDVERRNIFPLNGLMKMTLLRFVMNILKTMLTAHILINFKGLFSIASLNMNLTSHNSLKPFCLRRAYTWRVD